MTIASRLADKITARNMGRIPPGTLQSRLAKLYARQATQQGPSNSLIQAAAQRDADQELHRRRSLATTSQLSLLDGDIDTDAMWQVGEGEHVLVRKHVRGDLMARLTHSADNASRIAAAHAKLTSETTSLLPYYVNESTTWEEAHAAWQRAHPTKRP